MAQPAYVILNADGTVARCHSPTIGGINPTIGSTDLETLIQSGFLAVREVPLEGGKMLIVVSKP
jgi:hypothetical protein